MKIVEIKEKGFSVSRDNDPNAKTIIIKEMESEKSKVSQKQLIIADVIGWLLFISGIFNFISYFILIFSQDVTDKWFERQALSLICFGFAGIIFRLKYGTKV